MFAIYFGLRKVKASKREKLYPQTLVMYTVHVHVLYH